MDEASFLTLSHTNGKYSKYYESLAHSSAYHLLTYAAYDLSQFPIESANEPTKIFSRNRNSSSISTECDYISIFFPWSNHIRLFYAHKVCKLIYLNEQDHLFKHLLRIIQVGDDTLTFQRLSSNLEMIQPAPSYSRSKGLAELCRAFRPNKPTYLPEEYPDLTNRTAIVTGANTGIGFHVSKLLYAKNCNVILVVRTESKGLAASENIKKETRNSKGSITVVSGCDFMDLSTVKQVGTEIEKVLGDKPLSIIIHNAGLMAPDSLGTSKQGYEAMFSVNVLGPQLLQHFLDPLFLKKDDPLKRIVWVSSGAHFSGFPEYGISWENPTFEGVPIGKRPHYQTLYGQSKAANIFQAKAWATTHKVLVEEIGCVSVSCFPGIVKTELMRNWGSVSNFIARRLLYDGVYGAYTELYAALYPKLSTKDQGAYIFPFGEIHDPREDVKVGLTNGTDLKLWDYVQGTISLFF